MKRNERKHEREREWHEQVGQNASLYFEYSTHSLRRHAKCLGVCMMNWLTFLPFTTTNQKCMTMQLSCLRRQKFASHNNSCVTETTKHIAFANGNELILQLFGLKIAVIANVPNKRKPFARTQRKWSSKTRREKTEMTKWKLNNKTYFVFN